MRTFSVASGSSGNCIFIESEQGAKVLVDFGLSYSRTKEILEQKGIEIESITAVFITHEHADHVAGLESFLKNCSAKCYITKGTAEALNFNSENFIFIKDHELVNIKDLKVLSVSKPHDANEPVHFILDDGKKLGVFTDFGHVDDRTLHLLKNLDLIYFETNYCEDHIVKNKEKYNPHYLQRLTSNVGHLGLKQSIDAILEFASDSQKIILSHISENSNTYENTYTKVVNSVKKNGLNPQIYVSFQGEPSPWIE